MLIVFVASQTYDLPSSFPEDPVDRIIGATALMEDIPLLTADREIRASRAVPTIWLLIRGLTLSLSERICLNRMERDIAGVQVFS